MKKITITPKGLKTREKILHQAADLIYENGVKSTSIDDVLRMSKKGKSQFYHFFENKERLVREVIQYRFDNFSKELNTFQLEFNNWETFRLWFDRIVNWHQSKGFAGSCPLGAIAMEVSCHDTLIQSELNRLFSLIIHHIARGLESMKNRGILKESAKPDELAEYVFASIQGGFILSKISKDKSNLENVLFQTLNYLQSFENE